MIPRVTDVRRDDTHRLIPSRDSDRSVLDRLAEDDEALQRLFDLDTATNDRVLGEANLLPGISVHELVFGVAYTHIVNAAFTHVRPGGSRFNGPDRGAWYAAFEKKTAEAEVAFHKATELREIAWNEPESFTFDDYLADFRGPSHDIRRDDAHGDCLDPTSYATSQSLAVDLLTLGSAGIVYPSVRRKAGTCIVCFRPTLVTHVRRGSRVTISFENSASPPVFR